MLYISFPGYSFIYLPLAQIINALFTWFNQEVRRKCEDNVRFWSQLLALPLNEKYDTHEHHSFAWFYDANHDPTEFFE